MDGFIIIGTRSGLFYKDVFPLIQEGKITMGYTHNHINGEQPFCFKDPNGEIVSVDQSAKWITNIRDTFTYQLPLTETYTPEDYPIFDNYPDAINVDSIRKIPKDYYGVMGITICFIYKYNPEQFDIVGVINAPILKGKNIYRRVLIRRKNYD